MASEKCAIGILLGRADCDDTTITQRWRKFFSGFGWQTSYTSYYLEVALVLTNSLLNLSLFCFNHEMYYVTSDKLFNKPNNKCCNPFHLHATERLVFG